MKCGSVAKWNSPSGTELKRLTLVWSARLATAGNARYGAWASSRFGPEAAVRLSLKQPAEHISRAFAP